MHPHFLTALTLKMYNFWGVMLCRYVINYRIFEGKRTFRNAGIHSSNKTKTRNWIPEPLGYSLLLHFILSVTFYWFCTDIFHFSQLPRDNLLEFWSDGIRKLLFSSLIYSPTFAALGTLLRPIPLNVLTYGTRPIWRLVFKLFQSVNFSARWKIISQI